LENQGFATASCQIDKPSFFPATAFFISMGDVKTE